MITFTLPVEPKSVQNGAGRIGKTKEGKSFIFKNRKASGYQQTITLLSRKYAPRKPFEGPVKVDFTFILSRPKNLFRKSDPDGLIPHDKQPDADNMRKGAQDALQGFWLNDSQIFDGKTTKFYAEKKGVARIIVTVTEDHDYEMPGEEIERAY